MKNWHGFGVCVNVCFVMMSVVTHSATNEGVLWKFCSNNNTVILFYITASFAFLLLFLLVSVFFIFLPDDVAIRVRGVCVLCRLPPHPACSSHNACCIKMTDEWCRCLN